MPITDDPIADFNRRDAEQTAWLKKRPICIECGEHIQDETAFYINGEWFCDRCIEIYRRVVIDE